MADKESTVKDGVASSSSSRHTHVSTDTAVDEKAEETTSSSESSLETLPSAESVSLSTEMQRIVEKLKSPLCDSCKRRIVYDMCLEESLYTSDLQPLDANEKAVQTKSLWYTSPGLLFDLFQRSCEMEKIAYSRNLAGNQKLEQLRKENCQLLQNLEKKNLNPETALEVTRYRQLCADLRMELKDLKSRELEAAKEKPLLRDLEKSVSENNDLLEAELEATKKDVAALKTEEQRRKRKIASTGNMEKPRQNFYQLLRELRQSLGKKTAMITELREQGIPLKKSLLIVWYCDTISSACVNLCVKEALLKFQNCLEPLLNFTVSANFTQTLYKGEHISTHVRQEEQQYGQLLESVPDDSPVLGLLDCAWNIFSCNQDACVNALVTYTLERVAGILELEASELQQVNLWHYLERKVLLQWKLVMYPQMHMDSSHKLWKQMRNAQSDSPQQAHSEMEESTDSMHPPLSDQAAAHLALVDRLMGGAESAVQTQQPEMTHVDRAGEEAESKEMLALFGLPRDQGQAAEQCTESVSPCQAFENTS